MHSRIMKRTVGLLVHIRSTRQSRKRSFHLAVFGVPAKSSGLVINRMLWVLRGHRTYWAARMRLD